MSNNKYYLVSNAEGKDLALVRVHNNERVRLIAGSLDDINQHFFKGTPALQDGLSYTLVSTSSSDFILTHYIDKLSKQQVEKKAYKRLSSEEKQQAIELLNKGLSINNVADRLDVSRSNIRRLKAANNL